MYSLRQYQTIAIRMATLLNLTFHSGRYVRGGDNYVSYHGEQAACRYNHVNIQFHEGRWKVQVRGAKLTRAEYKLIHTLCGAHQVVQFKFNGRSDEHELQDCKLFLLD